MLFIDSAEENLRFILHWRYWPCHLAARTECSFDWSDNQFKYTQAEGRKKQESKKLTKFGCACHSVHTWESVVEKNSNETNLSIYKTIKKTRR